MDWLNLHVSVLDSPECLRCDPVRRATWLWLLRYCIGQENGGVIQDCRSWGDTTWQQLCRVRLKEVNSESPLWSWEGEQLRVCFYPIEKQAEVQAKRDAGQRGGRPKLKPLNNHMVNHMVNHQVERAETEGKGMGKEIGKEVEVNPAREDRPPPDHQDIFTLGEIPAKLCRSKTLGDLEACFPRLIVLREDRGKAEATLALFGWDACAEGLRELGPIADKRPSNRRRIFVSELSAWLNNNFTPEPEDYQRAGLPIPEGKT